MQRITPYLWFESQAEEAANHYVSIFPDSKIVDVQRYGEGAPVPAGTVMMVTFELQGQRFMALNGGPQFTFNEAISFYVDCATQREVDEFWARLSDGGEEGQCGWLKDRFGVSWQVIPEALPRLLTDPDPEKAGRVMQAMFEMKKIRVQDLQDAYEGR
jgi:predicted 3-demethylubiquinone-9 3-methyltransferase (glyoxalase superfamily)